MKVVQKEVYTFGELLRLEEEGTVDSRVVEQVREKLQEWATDGDWWEYTVDLWEEALEQVGFTEVKIYFSGFANQGDGASFEARVNVEKVAAFLSTDIPPCESINVGEDGKTEQFLPWVVGRMGGKVRGGKVTRPAYRRIARIAEEWLEGSIVRDRYLRYAHENTCTLSVEWQTYGEHTNRRLEALVKQFEADAEDLRVSLCHAIYRSLREEYEWLTSDEQLTESSEANEYMFDARGRME